MNFDSSRDLLALVAELNQRRITATFGKLRRRLGAWPILTKQQQSMLETARRMHRRYSRNDYTHSLAEASEIRDLCNWILQLHSENEGVPLKQVQPDITAWKVAVTDARTRPVKGDYLRFVHGEYN